MPIYMDVHDARGAEPTDLAEAHRKDMLIEGKHRCKCMTYWFDEVKGIAFCLIEAPTKTAMIDMHKEAHGLIPHKIIEVNNEIVESFLGRTKDPADAEVNDRGLKVFAESAFRILLVSDILDPVILKHAIGEKKATDLAGKINSIVRKEIAFYGGSEVEHPGLGFIVSFTSAVKAADCAKAIFKNISAAERKSAGFSIALHGGEPVSKSSKVFGDTIQLASCLCTVESADSRIMISNVVKDLLGKDLIQKDKKFLLSLSLPDEQFMDMLFAKLQKNWQDPEFTVTEFCRALSMSKSQLYRKTIALWGMSPNQLLNEFKLNRAKELLKKQAVNISQATFDSGFNSPSYFTKCFKKKFGLLPAAYQHALA